MSSANSQEPTLGAALERTITALLRWGSRSAVRRAMRSDRLALTATDGWLLGRLIDVGPTRMSDLAAWQSVDRSTMTTQVGRLERQGLVERRPDPDDGRASLVRPTAKGRRTHEGNLAETRRVLDGLVADWDEADRAELSRLLGRLVESIDRLPAS